MIRTLAAAMVRPDLLEGLSVTLARRPAELEAVVPAWEELASAALEPNPFYEHWMLRPALEAFGAGRELRVVLVWAGERLAGLFPFERVARYKGLPLPAFKSWRHAHCLLCTPLVRADTARACLEALFDCHADLREKERVEAEFEECGRCRHVGEVLSGEPGE